MKWKSLGTTILIAAFILTGCSNGSSSKQSSTTPGANDTFTDTKKLTWFSNVSFWNPPQTWSTDPNTVQGIISQKTGLTFEMNIPPQDADTKLNLILASGSDMPDLFTITNDTLIKKLIDSGKVWKIDELLKQNDPESHLFKDFPSDIKKVLELRDGGWYSFPSHMSSEDARSTWKPSDQFYMDGINYRNNSAIMFNTKLMEQAGIKLDDVKTEDGLMAVFKKVSEAKLTVNGAAVVPFLVDGKGYQSATLGVLRNMFGGMEVDKNGNYRDMLFSAENKHAIEFLYKAAKNSYLDPNQFTMDNTATKALVMSGRVFSFIGNTANTGFSDQENWVSSGPILSNTGAKPVMGMSKKTTAGWMQTLVSKSSKEPKRLAKFMSFMSSDEGLRLHYFGFKDKDYILNAKGLIEQTDTGKKNGADYSKTGVGAYWPFANISWHDSITQAPTTIKTGIDGITAMQVQCAFGKSKDTTIYDTAPLSLPANYIAAGSELDNIKTQVKTYREAQISKIILAKDDATMNKLYDEMINKIKELGLEKVDTKINEQVQKQYKEYGVTLKAIN